MTQLTAAAAEVLGTGARLAHLVTLNTDGRPHVTIVWTGVRDGKIVTAHMGLWKKLRNIQADPRVSLSVETGNRNPMGLDEYLVVEGTAEIVEGGAAELLQELAVRYLGEGVKFPPMDNPPAGYILHITPTKYSGVGPWNG
jgi:PPOX class probable F420-dependent enzyme